jgi:hypothetical protein
VSASSHSTGISGGDGADTITNESGGTITVTSEAKPSTTGDSRAVFDFGTVSGSATLDAVVTASGIDAGTGNNDLKNLGGITVIADSDTSARNSSQAGIIVGNTKSTASAHAIIQATAMAGGDDGNEISNTGTILNILKVIGAEPTDGPTVLAHSEALGPAANITVTSDAISTATATLSAQLQYAHQYRYGYVGECPRGGGVCIRGWRRY